MSDAHPVRPVYVLDIEVYKNVFLVGLKRLSDGKIRIFEQSEREDIDYRLLRRILLSGTIVTFNGRTYDMPIVQYAIDGEQRETEVLVEDDAGQGELVTTILARRDRTNAEIKAVSDIIIKRNVRWWEIEREIGVEIPRALDHVDLIEPQPNPFASLKILNGRMHGRWMQDLPYHFDSVLTVEQIDRLREYLANDLQATEDLWMTLAEPMQLRSDFGSQIGMDLRSMSDTQMGLAVIKQRCEKLLKKRIPRGGAIGFESFKYVPPTYIEFQTPVLRKMLDQIREHDFHVLGSGKVDLPEFLMAPFQIGQSSYAMGIGGLHSTESNRSLRADQNCTLVDADVASYYPAIILSLGLYPEAIGPAFLDVYREIRDERVAAKKDAKVLKKHPDAESSEIKKRLKHLGVVDKGLKIALNGTFGSLGSPYKIVYAPHLLISVTLTGQLALLMLIERAEAAGIRVVSANTDGVLFHCPRSDFAGVDGDRLRPCALERITDAWEKETQFDLEFSEYSSVFSQSVNSYFAIKKSGGHKRKGPLANPWSSHPDDYDPIRGQLMKNPQATICSEAALALIKYGTPIAETIRGSRDVRQFVTVIKVTKGATWRGDYLGKVVRYYWANSGDDILESEPNNLGNFKKVPKTDGCRPLMTLPDEFPVDVDYGRYISETESILESLGYYGTPQPPLRFGRLTASKFERATLWLMLT